MSPALPVKLKGMPVSSVCGPGGGGRAVGPTGVDVAHALGLKQAGQQASGEKGPGVFPCLFKVAPASPQHRGRGFAQQPWRTAPPETHGGQTFPAAAGAQALHLNRALVHAFGDMLGELAVQAVHLDGKAQVFQGG